MKHLERCTALGAEDARLQERSSERATLIDLTGHAEDADMQVHTPPELLQQVEEISDSDCEHEVRIVRMSRYVQLHPWAAPTEIVYSFEPQA